MSSAGTNPNMPPDAWDDDWVTKADASKSTPDPAPSSAKVSKAERRKQQAEFNRQIWERENSDRPEDNFFLQTRGVVPLKSEFKPQMKVLSRKPTKPTNSDSLNGAVGNLNLEDEEDEDDDASKDTLTPEQRLEKAQREREERQKAYEERRRQLFGNDEAPTRPNPTSKSGSPRNQSRVKNTSDSRPSSAASNKNRQLFDPSESTKPEALRPQKFSASNEIQPIREPKAPDGSGRGGFGFAPRGGRNT